MEKNGIIKKYTILAYNFNNYEILREPEEIDPECEYLYITDNANIKSNIWKVIVDPALNNMSAFDKCYSVRFNLFKYATTKICIYIDASIQIHKSLRPLYNAFINSNADVGLNIHPDCDNVYDEYIRWIHLRNYSKLQMQKCLCMFKAAGWNPKDKGLYQGTLRICKNTELNRNIDEFTFAILKKLGTNNVIERLDQTIYSFVINKFFNNIKIFPFSQQVFQSKYATWCVHGNTTPIGYCNNNLNDGYVIGKLEKLFYLE